MIEFIGIALLHSLWQMTLLAAFYAGLNRVLNRDAAGLRYGLGCVTLVAMIVMPVMTATWHGQERSSPMTSPSSSMDSALTPDNGRNALSDASRGNPSMPMMAAQTPAKGPQSGWFMWSVALWALGVLIMVLRPLIGLHRLRQIQAEATSRLPAYVSGLLHQLQTEMGISRSIALLQSQRLHTPSVCGLFRPVLLLPASILTGLPPEQIRALIAHELAHIRRHDFLVNLVQLGIETVAFYHPAVWWVSRRVRQERENCCDDAVIRICGHPASYAAALLALETRRQDLTLALAAGSGSIRDRIERLATKRRASSRQHSRLIIPLAIVISVLLFALGVRKHTTGTFLSTAKDSQSSSTSLIPHNRASLMTEDASSSSALSSHPFWIAVANNDLETARRLLEADPTLASRDFRPPEKQDPHTHGFPLVKAAASGNQEMVKLLIEFGADVNAASPHEELREFGSPLALAVERKDYEMANLLLDYGASTDAHGYCVASTMDDVYEDALEAGAPQEMVRKGFEKYLGPAKQVSVSENAPAAIKLFDRFLNVGGQPSMESLVRSGYNELVEELFLKVPEEPGTQHDHPHGTVFQTLCNAATWCGYPDVMEIAMRCCPNLHTPETAKRAISRALVSHNRDGTVADYHRLIEGQLRLLQEQGALEATIADGSLLPYHLLARDYLWPGWYGNEESPSSVQSMIELTDLFHQYGFNDFNRQHPESGLSPLGQVQARDKHPGLDGYAAYLKEQGAKAGDS